MGKKERGFLEDLFPSGVYELCLLGVIIVVIVISSVLSGCSIKETNGTKISDIEYTIVETSEIPDELMKMIEEKKAADFKLSYELENEMYVVHGYGEQETGGYSICVKDFYLTSNAIIFDTELIGPRKGETTSQSPSYPYIVVKTSYYDESIIFE